MPVVTYPARAGEVRGYLAVPTGPGPWPAVVVIHDVRGMTADLRALTDKFAHAGYLALAPNLYSRRCVAFSVYRTIQSHFSGTGDAYDDITAARQFLVADERCTGKVGIAGFCMGAGFVYLAAVPGGQFDVAASNYGLLPRDLTMLEDACPIVASFGGKDRVVKPGSATKLEEALAKYGVPHDVKEYPEAGHAYMNSMPLPGLVRRGVGMAYSSPDAEDSWRRLFAFFSEHLC